MASVEAGLASGLQVGSATIEASYGGHSAQSSLTVTSATLVSLSITPSAPSIAKGTTQTFTASGIFSDGTFQDVTTSVVWSSDNETVAIIAAGLAQAVSPGRAEITARLAGKSTTAALTVTPATLRSLALSGGQSTIVGGTSTSFILTGTFSDGSTQNLTSEATWTTSSTPPVEGGRSKLKWFARGAFQATRRSRSSRGSANPSDERSPLEARIST